MAALAGCSALRPPAVPMRVVDLARDGGGRCLVVLLPGRWDEPEKFGSAGFAAAVARRRLALDLVAVDSHLGYFRDGSIVERLHADVIAPARAAGYDSIWIAGTSLGGLGGLLYLRDHPEDLAGVLALAPYLGEPALMREIELAGGPERWRSVPAPAAADPPDPDTTGDAGRSLWTWLAPWAGAGQGPPIYLGWGTSDGFDRSNRLLAGLLPPERVITSAGGHDWRIWERLWEQFLDRTALCASASPAARR